MSVTLDDVRAAAARIEGRVRRTPMLGATAMHAPLRHAGPVVMKLECLQAIGSFKARGATSKLTTLSAAETGRGLVTASGGNHGLGVAYAGWQAGAPVRIYLPASTPKAKADKLRAWGAEVIIHGAVWDEANAEALAAAERDGLTYAHPFADADVIAGQGTTALEILEDDPDIDVLLVAIGGGGLISGVATAAKAVKPDIKVIGVEATGAPTLYESLKAGELVTLERIETEAGTLAPRRSAEINFEIIGRCVDEIVLVTDDDMRAAAQWLWFEFGIAAELSGAAAIAALQAEAYMPEPKARVCAIVCGAGTDGVA